MVSVLVKRAYCSLQYLRWCPLIGRHLSSGGYSRPEPDFGIMFDIDGVIVRGQKVIPAAQVAFRKLVNQHGKFRVPTVFVTNAGNCTRQSKAEQLSALLGIEVSEAQVVMAHSPLRLLTEYHSKHVLVVGQGPVGDIAVNNGFKDFKTIDDVRRAFPTLDAVDHSRRKVAACSFEDYFPRLEGVVLFGEPIRWETSLQLIVDVLISDGLPTKQPKIIPYPHIPVLACNMDLQWMAEANMPRFAHGAFLLCLENLYKKITGNELIYSVLVGKPSEMTYIYGEKILQSEATKIGLSSKIKTVYCIGDNVCTDIFGANLYNRYLQKRREELSNKSNVKMAALSASSLTTQNGRGVAEPNDESLIGAEQCFSILVETGVYSPDDETDQEALLNHSPRDFLPVDRTQQVPTYIVNNVLDAVRLIFENQKYS